MIIGLLRSLGGRLAWGERAWTFVAGHRRLVAMAVYGGVAAVAYVLAYFLRFDFGVPPEHVATLGVTLPILVAVRLVASSVFRLAMGRWRFVSTEDVVRLATAGVAGSLVFVVGVAALPLSPAVPLSVVVVELVLTVLLTAGAWLAYRLLFERIRHARSERNGRRKRVMIVGAGEAGNLLAREILRTPTGYELVGFVDDDPMTWGATLHGVEVLGSTEDLGDYAEHFRVDEIIIAVPSASPPELRRIVERCETQDRPFKVLPGISEVLDGEVRLGHVRDLRIEDLLGREPVSLELPELAAELRGRSVLITGAAGSIGSELARQVAVHEPARLVLLDQAETDLFFVERDLRENHPELSIVAVVGDILDREGVRRVFEEHDPRWVFHAAAYKHVPMMECNVREAVKNNVLGTRRIARAAGRHGSERFVLISTDKAVEPSSVMGATKRAAELVTMACEDDFPDTSFLAVRFGNVLGSQGSVVPIFERQLEEGKPLTVTHPDVTRYFMTLSEAVQLVLKASTLREAEGEIAMLDMGEPIRILDLARDLIRLHGLRPGTDVEIEFIGLRLGEKLHEELTGRDEATVPTPVEKVRIMKPEPLERTNGDLRARLAFLSELPPRVPDDVLRSLLFAAVNGEPLPRPLRQELGRRRIGEASGDVMM